jgi:hypothetical protein
MASYQGTADLLFIFRGIYRRFEIFFFAEKIIIVAEELIIVAEELIIVAENLIFF